MVQVVMRQVVPDVSGDEAREERVVQMRAEHCLERPPQHQSDGRRDDGRHHEAIGIVRIVVVDAVDEPGSVALPFDLLVRLPVKNPAVQQVLEQGPSENAEREHAGERAARKVGVAPTMREQPGDIGTPDEHHVPRTHA